MRKSSKAKTLYAGLFLFCASLFLVCTCFLYVNFQSEKTYELKQEKIASIMNSQVSENTDDTDAQKFSRYQKLHELNEDFVGFLEIEGTNIFYPVMQSKNRPNFYLSHDFEKSEDIHGTPYIQEDCQLENEYANLIIHGHHMRNGTMFAALQKFADEGFYTQHRTIYFDTLEELGTYDILGFFETEVGEFEYYHFPDLSDPEKYRLYVDQVKELSPYETGIEPVYGKKLITLSTCGYYNSLKRIVLVGQRQ